MTRCVFLMLCALLQWSSAEITNASPESWYNANVINDATYTPKPILELFSTDPTTFTTQTPTYSSISPEFSSQDPTFTSQISFSSQDPSFSSQNPNLFSTPDPNFPTSSTQSPTFQPQSPTFSTVNPIVVLPSSTQSNQPISTGAQPTTTQGTTSDPSSTVTSSSTTSQTNPPQFDQPGGVAQPQNYFVFYQNGRTPTSSSTETVNITPSQSTRSPSTSTPAPTTNSTARIPFIRIRMVSPMGTITNVNVNPPSSTRRPRTTRRNRRRNRNTYDDCIDACGERRSPICATPLSSRQIDPDNLKGFPSICHMACHNSFRRQPYEKVIDGRCGRLRTRIRPVDSNNKLRRDELNRAQYTVVQNPHAIIEFQPMNTS